MTAFRSHSPSRLSLALAALSITGLWTANADASGLSTARFGGEHGHPTTENATGIYYNPGAIALSKGTHIYIDGLIALRKVTYERPDSAVSPQNGLEGNPNYSLDNFDGANNGKASLFNVAGAPFIGVTSDFGTDFIYGGLAAYVPFGGGAMWGRNEDFADSGVSSGAVNGVQRWYAIDGTIRSFYITGALAFKIKPAKLTIGFSGSAIFTSFDTIRARNADGTDNIVSGGPDPEDFALKEGRSWLQASGWQGGFGVGVTYQPLDNKLWIGASYTSQPNVTGGMTLKGTLTNRFTVSANDDTTDIELTQSFPDIIRLGFRYRPIPKLELRLYADYTRWSVTDKQCVMIATEPDRKCEFDNADTALEDPENFGGNGDGVVGVTQHLPRFWKDAGGVRLGAGYWLIDELEAYIGLGYDSSAIPVETIDPALFDMDKFSVTVGALWQAHKRVAVGATVGQIIYLTVDTDGKSVLNKFDTPTRQASAEGVYKQWLTIGNLYLDISF